jgi:hypothetical protein
MTASSEAFARDLALIGDACAGVLTRLYEVVQAQQRSVLALAPSGHRGVSVGKAQSAAPAVAPVAASESALPGGAGQEILQAGMEASRAIADSSPEVAIAALQQVAVHAIGLAMYDVVAQQQNLATLAQAVIAAEVKARLAGSQQVRNGAEDAVQPAASTP